MLSSVSLSPSSFARDVYKYDDAIGQIPIATDPDPEFDPSLLDFINIDSIIGLNGSEEINSLHGDEDQYEEEEDEEEEEEEEEDEDTVEEEEDKVEDDMDSLIHLHFDECKTNFEGCVVEGENANEELDVMASISSLPKISSSSTLTTASSPVVAISDPLLSIFSSSSTSSHDDDDDANDDDDDGDRVTTTGYNASSDCTTAGNQSMTWVLGTFGIMKPSRYGSVKFDNLLNFLFVEEMLKEYDKQWLRIHLLLIFHLLNN